MLATLFNVEKLAELESLSALNYSPEEMALYFDVDKDYFIQESQDSESKINYHIRRGKLMAKAQEQMSFLSSAQGGNVSASQQLHKINRDQHFSFTRDDVFFGLEQSQFEKLEAYFESGSTKQLTKDEEIYLDFLSLIPGMYRKYGRRKTLSALIAKPYNLTRFKAKEILEEALNLFYIDHDIDRNAMRNLKAEQLEEAALIVANTAQSPKDFEIYERLVISSAKLRRLDEPEPPMLPKGIYQKPVKVYVLDCDMVGIPGIDRSELAAQIDGLKVPEAVKTRIKRESMIEDVIPLEEMLYEYKEEAED